MTTLILLIPILSSASGGLLGVLIWYKHFQKILTSKGTTLDSFLGNSTTAALLILALGAGGYWLPNVLLLQFVTIQVEESRSLQPTSTIHAVPLGE